MPTYIAALITALLTFAILVSTQWAVILPDRHQMISAFVLTTLLSTLLIFLREYKARQLAPLRRTDELTQAASREYLSADLHKEIQRSEREGTDMSVMMIGLDTHLSDNDPDEDIRAILPRIGRYLHSQLRDFDTYYRVADLQFLVILPGINTAGAAASAEKIRNGLCKLLASHGMKLTVSTGIAGLNIGDDADSLQHSAANALRRAQQQGATAPRPTATGCTRMSRAPPAPKVTRDDRNKTQNLDSQLRLRTGGPVHFLAGTAEPALRLLRVILSRPGDDLPVAGRADLHLRVSPPAAIGQGTC